MTIDGRRGLRSGLVSLVAGSLGARVIAAFGFWFIGARLGPAEVGQYAAVMAALAVPRSIHESVPRDMVIGGWNRREQRRASFRSLAIATAVAAVLIGLTFASDRNGFPLGWSLALLLGIGVWTPWGLAAGHLATSRAFGKLGRAESTAAAIQYLGGAALLIWWPTPSSLLLAVFISQLVYGLRGTFLLRSRGPNGSQMAPLGSPATTDRLRPRFFALVLGASGTAFLSNADYMALNLVSSPETLGLYFFGFQLVAQGTGLASTSLYRFLYPTMASGRSSEFDVAGLVRALWFYGTIVAVVGAIASGPIISLLWGNRWEGTVMVVQGLMFGFTARISFGALRAILTARGLTSRWAILVWGSGLALFAVTITLASLGADAGGLALGTSAVFLLSAIVGTAWVGSDGAPNPLVAGVTGTCHALLALSPTIGALLVNRSVTGWVSYWIVSLGVLITVGALLRAVRVDAPRLMRLG